MFIRSARVTILLSAASAACAVGLAGAWGDPTSEAVPVFESAAAALFKTPSLWRIFATNDFVP